MEIVKSKIPQQLQKDGFGFVRLKARTKIPFEQDWQINISISQCGGCFVRSRHFDANDGRIE